MPHPPDCSHSKALSHIRQLLPATLVLLFLTSGCGGGTDLLLLPGDGAPASIRLENGEQSGRVGEPLADSLVFVVSDSRLQPVPGARIAFDLSGAPGAQVLPDTAETDSDGRAQVRFVLGTTVGEQVVQAMVVVPEGAQAATTTFRVTALSENANGIAALSGDDQTAPAGATLSQPLVVQVTDAFGNPISGVTIDWSAEGGGTVSEASNVTDVDGRASVQRTLGPTAGTQTTLATSGGLAGSPVTFTHTATAGSAAGLSIVSGDGQTAQAGTELPGDLVVRLVDAAGNGVPGAAVTWVVGTGGGRVSPENTTTDDAGRASSRWTLGPNPGENRVDAVVSGVGVVHFVATGTSTRPAGLVILTQPSNSTQNGEALSRQPVIQVRDGSGNPVGGVVVTAQLAGGGGELLGTRQLGSDGTGRVAYSDLAIAGAAGTRRLVFTAPGYAGATSAEITVRAAATTTTITSDSPDPSVAGGAVTVTFRVSAERVVPTGTVTVSDGSQSCTGTLVGGAGSCQLSLTATGTRTIRATYGGSAGLSGSSDTEGHQVNPAQSANNPPHAEFHPACNDLSCSFSDASSDSDGSVTGWSWSFGDGATSNEREPTHVYPAPGNYLVTLTVTDDDGATNQASARVQVQAPPPPPPVNQPPVAAFSGSCDQLNCSFNSDASSDSDGRVAGYNWNFGDGTGSNDRNPRHNYAAPGQYDVTLTVTDDDGAVSAPVTHQVTATAPPPPANKPPHADFSANCDFLTCTFQDRSTDDDGTVVSRSWNFGDGTTSTETNPTHTYQSPDKYKVTLTVTDDRGGTDSRDHDVDAKAPPPENQSPTAAFSSSCPQPGLACSFTDGSADPDGSIQSRTWNFGDNTTSTDRNPAHTYSAAGVYTVTLTVTDNDGASGTASDQVTLNAPPAPNQAPTAAFSSDCPSPGLSCSFNSDGSSDSDGNVVGWSWSFGDGTSSNERNPNHTYASGSTYNVSLTVMDDDGATSSPVAHPVTLTAANTAPVARIGSISCTGMHCEYTDQSTDANGTETIASYAWVFGDGASADVKNPSHDYARSGDYQVTLTVTDDHNASAMDQRTVSISAPNDSSSAPANLIAKGPPS